MDADRLRRLQEFKLAANATIPYPGFSGYGIVTCASPKYLAYLWIQVKTLRHFGCVLPIEVWQLPDEVDSRMMAQFAGLNVVFRVAKELHYDRRLQKSPPYQIKPYAISHSRFEDVLFLDADNSATRDPSFLFDLPEYHRDGALFWPDCNTLSADLGCGQLWRDFDLSYDESFEFETGQIAINKKRHWAALNATMFLNDNWSFYYRFMHGDKDTFRLAFDFLRSPYFVIPHRPAEIRFHQNRFRALLQSGPDGGPLFTHQAGALHKWRRNSFLVSDHYFPCLPLELAQKWFRELILRHPIAFAGECVRTFPRRAVFNIRQLIWGSR